MKAHVGDTVIIKADYDCPISCAGTSWVVELADPNILQQIFPSLSYNYVCYNLNGEGIGGHTGRQIRNYNPALLKHEGYVYRYFDENDIERVIPRNSINALGNFPKKNKEV